MEVIPAAFPTYPPPRWSCLHPCAGSPGPHAFLARPSGMPGPCLPLKGCSLSLNLPYPYHLALPQHYPVSVQMSLPLWIGPTAFFSGSPLYYIIAAYLHVSPSDLKLCESRPHSLQMANCILSAPCMLACGTESVSNKYLMFVEGGGRRKGWWAGLTGSLA